MLSWWITMVSLKIQQNIIVTIKFHVWFCSKIWECLGEIRAYIRISSIKKSDSACQLERVFTWHYRRKLFHTLELSPLELRDSLSIGEQRIEVGLNIWMSANQKNLVDRKIPTVTCRRFAGHPPTRVWRSRFSLKMLTVDVLSTNAERDRVKLKYLNIINPSVFTRMIYATLWIFKTLTRLNDSTAHTPKEHPHFCIYANAHFKK